MVDVKATFAKFVDEYNEFHRIESPPFRRPDLCAFVLLEKLAPEEDAGMDMVSAARHDLIWLQTDIEKLSATATEEDIRTLARCGVRYDAEYDCLTMFV